MKKLLAVILVLVMILSFTACGRKSKKPTGSDGQIDTSIISDDQNLDNFDDYDPNSAYENADDKENKDDQNDEVIVNDNNGDEQQNADENNQQEDKTIKKMYSSKKDLKSNAHFILYSDGTWSYQSDSVSLVISDEDDINDIKNRIQNGELFVITESDLNNVAAG